MSRIALLLCALVLLPCALFSQTEQAAAPADAAVTALPGPIPPRPDYSEMRWDCLLAGECADPAQFSGLVERLMEAIGEKPEPGMLLKMIGGTPGDPEMAGVALDRPARFFYMALPPPEQNGQLDERAWVFQFSILDAEALKKGMGAVRPAPEGHPDGALECASDGSTDERATDGALHPEEKRAPPRFLLIQDGTATIYSSPTACADLLDWQMTNGPVPKWRMEEQFRCRLAVQHVLAAYGPEYEKEVQAMRDRMREALERLSNAAEREESVRNAQAQLDAASSLLKQVEYVELGIQLSEKAAVLRAEAVPLPDSALSKLIQAHPRGSPGLLASCPAAMDLAFTQNISAAEAAGSLLLNHLGLPGMSQAIGAASAQTLYALSLPRGTDAAVSALLIRANQQAESAQQEWERMTQGDIGTAFSLRPIEPPPGATASIAEVVLNEEVLGPERTRALRNVIGMKPMAAHEVRDGRSVLAVGATPLALLDNVRALGRDEGAASLWQEAAFKRTVALLPGAPNMLLYASPSAVAEWWKLAELPAVAPGEDALGLAAAISFTPDGRVAAGAVLPLDQLQMKMQPK